MFTRRWSGEELFSYGLIIEGLKDINEILFFVSGALIEEILLFSY